MHQILPPGRPMIYLKMIFLIHRDALTTLFSLYFLVAAQSNYLHSGENVIIEHITDQKDQLEISNQKLQRIYSSP